MEVAFHGPIEDSLFLLYLRNESRHTILATSTDLHDSATSHFEAGDSAVVRADLPNWLAGADMTSPRPSRAPAAVRT